MVRAWIVCAVFALALFNATARAQTPSEESLVVAREVVVLAGGEAAAHAMMETMRPMMLADLRSRGVPQDFAERYVVLFIEEFRVEMPRLNELSAIAYAGAFTLEQLREMRAFFGSETGRALAAHAPELTAAMTRAGALIAEDIAPRVIARMESEPPAADPS
jgi:hypothetical protein